MLDEPPFPGCSGCTGNSTGNKAARAALLHLAPGEHAEIGFQLSELEGSRNEVNLPVMIDTLQCARRSRFGSLADLADQ